MDFRKCANLVSATQQEINVDLKNFNIQASFGHMFIYSYFLCVQQINKKGMFSILLLSQPL